MNNTINAYEQYLDEKPGAVQTVAVLYHGAAIAIAMTNSVWNDLLFTTLKGAPPEIRSQFTDAKPGKGNPYAGDVAGLVKRGSSFFVCHNAIVGFAEIAAGVLKQPREKVHAAIMAGILPGALAVPAGVMAVNACQEAKFTYIAT
jgi:intracellular sulfur oxidation DsrE/DsrF family protein